MLLAVAHDSFRELGAEDLRALGDPEAHAIFDLKGLPPRDQTDGRLWSGLAERRTSAY